MSLNLPLSLVRLSSFKIIAESGVSSGVRRIEAVTNTAAIKFYNDKVDKVKNISNLLKTNNNQVEKKVEQLIEENQRINKELKLLKKNPTITDKNNTIKETIKGIIFEYVIFDDLAIKGPPGSQGPQGPQGTPGNLGGSGGACFTGKWFCTKFLITAATVDKGDANCISG